MSQRVAMARPRLDPAAEVRLTATGDLFFLHELADQADLCIEAAPAWTAALVERLDGTSTIDELHRQLTSAGHPVELEEVEQAVEALAQAGVIVDEETDVLAPRLADRFSRQLPHLARLSGSSGEQAQQQLLRARVCILGMGGLGSWTAWALAAAGVGFIRGVDGDRVERSNLNRQILYGDDAIGEPKALEAGRRLRYFWPELEYDAVVRQLEGPAAVSAAIAGCDVVIDAADWPPQLIGRWVTQACTAAAMPLVAMSQFPPKVRVGPTFIPGQTGCFQCRETEFRRQYPLYDQLSAARVLRAPSITFGPACGVVGALAASEAINVLVGEHQPATAGTAVVLDTRTMSLTHEQVTRDPDCHLCGTLARSPTVDRASSRPEV